MDKYLLPVLQDDNVYPPGCPGQVTNSLTLKVSTGLFLTGARQTLVWTRRGLELTAQRLDITWNDYKSISPFPTVWEVTNVVNNNIGFIDQNKDAIEQQRMYLYLRLGEYPVLVKTNVGLEFRAQSEHRLVFYVRDRK